MASVERNSSESMSHINGIELRSQLLTWYRANQRSLPWRATRDPYAIWVSEIMLQQTRASVVAEHYRSFMERFPTLSSLAEAADQDVLAQWSGLGYYNRARFLHKAARFVVNELKGELPKTAVELRTLPGIGVYTAAAIASIAHGEPVAVVDGNVERVLARLVGLELTGKSAQRRQIEVLANFFVDIESPGDFNQAMMELGATVCLPRNPSCALCPIVTHCLIRGEHTSPPRPRMTSKEVGYALVTRLRYEPVQRVEGNGDALSEATDEAIGEAMELKQAKPPKPSRRKKPAASLDTFLHREILLEQRPETQTVMPGLWELPSLIRSSVPDEELQMALRHAIMQVNYYVHIRSVLEPEVDSLTVNGGERRWVRVGELSTMALTGLARKVLKRAHLIPGTGSILHPPTLM